MPYGVDPTLDNPLDDTHDYLVDGNDDVWCPHSNKPYNHLGHMCVPCCSDYLEGVTRSKDDSIAEDWYTNDRYIDSDYI